MSESIAEMILPGTYIEVRAEGLISVGSIATGNIGIVGTAARGPRNEVRIVNSYPEAVELFGAYDPFGEPRTPDHPLSLVRALQLAFQGGARSCYAVRIANGDPTAASLALQAGGGPSFTLTAVDAGTWGRDILVSVINEGSAATPDFKVELQYRQVKEVFHGPDVTTVHA